MEKINIYLLKSSDIEIVFELLGQLKEHSPESYDHSIDVAEKSLILACALGLEGSDIQKLYTAGLFHDIGKLCIDAEILHKTNANDSEREYIRINHIEGTKTILSKHFDEDLVRLASHHHERLNCSGYPEHLSATKLDILDRILQVADVTSALQMNRSYKEAYSPDQVIAILHNLVSRGELDKKCVREIERIFLLPLKNKSQMGS